MPGFTKRFAAGGGEGLTYLWRVPIGRFDVVEVDRGAVELRYRRWPVVDVLENRPRDGGSIRASGNLALAGHRLRFCRFRLER